MAAVVARGKPTSKARPAGARPGKIEAGQHREGGLPEEELVGSETSFAMDSGKGERPWRAKIDGRTGLFGLPLACPQVGLGVGNLAPGA